MVAKWLCAVTWL